MEELFSLLLVTTLVAYSSTAIDAATAKSRDATAIADFTNKLSNPPPSWVHGGDPCSGTFVGITCDGYGRVTTINLTDNGLSGTLTPLVSTLRALEILELSGNKLSGAIPSFAGMNSLTRLVLYGNQFTALPPTDLFQGLTSLMTLMMDNLPLDPWEIPDTISDSTALQIFTASNVSFVGALPTGLAKLKSLTTLWLSYNYLTGTLPAWLSNLSSLEIISLDHQMSDMKLSGKIDIFASFKHLRLLWLQSNSFNGSLPDLNNSQLEALDVSNNTLTGLVPTSLMGLESLQNVVLVYNFLQGPFPVFQNGVMADVFFGNSFCQQEPGPCDQKVSILLEVASGFQFPLQLAQNWSGNDPCNGSWIGIVCKGGVVVGINLSGYRLSGIVSPAFANLSMLESVDLSDNRLAGMIPEALTSLANLKLLNLSHNNLSGILPKFNPSVEIIVEGISSNPQVSRESKSKARMIMIIVGSSLAAIIIVLLACLCLYCLMKKKKKKKEDLSEPKLATQHSTHATAGRSGTTLSTHLRTHVTTESSDSAYHSASRVKELPTQALMDATNSFGESMKLGEGGSAVVYKGILNEELVAIKKFSSNAMGTEELQGFLFEINTLGKLSHRNLVRLLGYCAQETYRLLVYEFMPGGTLRERLQTSDFHAPLTWVQRINISLDVARGIEYLHDMAHKPFIHRDLKSTNILLDQDSRAKISDFGLVRIDGGKSFTSKRAGTYGFMAPEYAESGELSKKIDVYAFGAVLMEIITGRKILDDSLHDRHLTPIFRRRVQAKENLRNIVDPTLELNGEGWNTLQKIAEVAYCCTNEEPKLRPEIHDCVSFIDKLLSKLMGKWKPIINSEAAETSSKEKMPLEEMIRNIYTSSSSSG